jgi:hypothetical protein
MVYDLIVASNWGYTLRPHSSNSTDRLPNGAFGVLPKKEFFFLAGSANFGGQSADLPANLTDFFFPEYTIFALFARMQNVFSLSPLRLNN